MGFVAQALQAEPLAQLLRDLPTFMVSSWHKTTTPATPARSERLSLPRPAHLDSLHGAHNHHGLGHTGSQAAQ